MLHFFNIPRVFRDRTPCLGLGSSRAETVIPDRWIWRNYVQWHDCTFPADKQKLCAKMYTVTTFIEFTISGNIATPTTLTSHHIHHTHHTHHPHHLHYLHFPHHPHYLHYPHSPHHPHYLHYRWVEDSSVVEPAPWGTQVMRGCGFESHCSPPAGPSCYMCAPTCLETENNLAPHMAPSPLRHIISQCAGMWESHVILTTIPNSHITYIHNQHQPHLLHQPHQQHQSHNQIYHTIISTTIVSHTSLSIQES